MTSKKVRWERKPVKIWERLETGDVRWGLVRWASPYNTSDPVTSAQEARKSHSAHQHTRQNLALQRAPMSLWRFTCLISLLKHRSKCLEDEYAHVGLHSTCCCRQGLQFPARQSISSCGITRGYATFATAELEPQVRLSSSHRGAHSSRGLRLLCFLYAVLRLYLGKPHDGVRVEYRPRYREADQEQRARGAEYAHARKHRLRGISNDERQSLL